MRATKPRAHPATAPAKPFAKGKGMSLPLWVYRIWQTQTGVVLNTYKKEPVLLGKLISELAAEGNINRGEAEAIVARAWALYVCADPPMYCLDTSAAYGQPGRKITLFPLSSFIEVSRGYVVAAFEQGEKAGYLPQSVAKLLPRSTR
jgi:hypothetical protein